MYTSLCEHFYEGPFSWYIGPDSTSKYHAREREEYKTVTLKNKYDTKKKANIRITVLYGHCISIIQILLLSLPINSGKLQYNDYIKRQNVFSRRKEGQDKFSMVINAEVDRGFFEKFITTRVLCDNWI